MELALIGKTRVAIKELYDEALIDMTGVLVSQNKPYKLDEGWNMIAYLRSEPASVDAILDAFTSDIIIVKDVLGMAYLPEWGFNGIGDMLAGQGYQIKLDASHELIYNANDDDYRMAQTPLVDNTPTAVDFGENTGSNMHLLVQRVHGIFQLAQKMSFMFTMQKVIW